MLFDPFEEQLNLPTFMVQFRNGQRIFDREVVGKEVIDLARFKVFIHNKSERIRIFLDGVVTNKAYGLIGENSGVFVHWHGLNDIVDHVVLCAKIVFPLFMACGWHLVAGRKVPKF